MTTVPGDIQCVRKGRNPWHGGVHRKCEANGYLVYVFREGRVEHIARKQEMKIRDFVWQDENAYKSLWSFVAKHDLVGRVVWANAPMDDPAVDMFSEPRMLHTKENEGTWLRIVDVEGALGERGYVSDGAVSIHVQEDRLASWNTGCWRLEVEAGKPSVTRIKGDGDVSMNVRTLSSLFSGMRNARTLANWGQIKGDTASIQQLNNLFEVHHSLHCPDHY